jgi:hypothetical protein
MLESGSLTQPERLAAAALIPANLIKSRRVILVIRIVSTVCGDGGAFPLINRIRPLEESSANPNPWEALQPVGIHPNNAWGIPP